MTNTEDCSYWKRVYPFIVLTDITNCFDSILHSRIADAVAGAANARLIGLLFFLLERLTIREPFTESPRVGLPVDEFDCSRRIGHMVLLVHDARMVAAVGEDAYLRWMDDQTFGAGSLKPMACGFCQASEDRSRDFTSRRMPASRRFCLWRRRRSTFTSEPTASSTSLMMN
jgi:hypothetical protein